MNQIIQLFRSLCIALYTVLPLEDKAEARMPFVERDVLAEFLPVWKTFIFSETAQLLLCLVLISSLSLLYLFC